MVHLFLYGFFQFLRLALILSIIGIVLGSIMAKLSHEYREMVIVDCAGRSTGRTVLVDMNTMTDKDGNHVEKYNDDDLY